MTTHPNLSLPKIPLPLFTVGASHTSGRSARRNFGFQDEYTAYVLADFFAGTEDFLVARIEGVEDLEAMIRTECGWLERYYQIKSRREGLGIWTIAALDKESVWENLFRVYRTFLKQRFEPTRQIELTVVVEGELGRDLVELREQGEKAVARRKLFRILSSSLAAEYTQPLADELVRSAIGGFISSLRFESRVAKLQDMTINRLISSGDLSFDEATDALQRLLASIRAESKLPQPTLLTPEILKEWLRIPERAVLEKRPIPDPTEVERGDLLKSVAAQLESTRVLLLHGITKVGKSHFVSQFIDYAGLGDSYFWFTCSGSNGDSERLAFQLASWIGQRNLGWQIRDDVQKGRLQPLQALDRLNQVRLGPALIVLDDCHRAPDTGFLAAMARLVTGSWNQAKLVLISEEKIPELQTVEGVQESAIRGLQPKEGVLYLSRLGMDVGPAVVELGLLCVQADGHPVLLKAIAAELPQRPTRNDVSALSQSLLSALSVQSFLLVLSSKLLKSLPGDVHRNWLARLAAVTFPFKSSLAMEVARLSPELAVSTADWNYLVSQVLDQCGPDQYLVPALLRPLLLTEGQKPTPNEIRVSSARHVFRNARASRHMDFWDFHGAIVALVLAERYEEAATRFSLSVASSLESITPSMFDLLFMVLNADAVQARLRNPFSRFLLLLAEIQVRLLGKEPPDYSRLVHLLRRIRLLPRTQLTDKALRHIRMTTHAVISGVRARLIIDQGKLDPREGRRAFAPLQTSLRMAVEASDAEFILFVLRPYGVLHTLEKQPEMELLKDALLIAPDSPTELPGDVLTQIYAGYVISSGYTNASLELCERHSLAYRVALRADALFASEHAIATILLERFSKYQDARDRVTAAAQEAIEHGASPKTADRQELRNY